MIPIKVKRGFIPPSNTIKTEIHDFNDAVKENFKFFTEKVYKKLPTDNIPKTKAELKIKKNWSYKKIIILGFLIIVIFSFFFLYLVSAGFLTPQFTQNLSFNPDIQIDSPTTNNIDVKPIINNEYFNDYTIINEINCPEQICVCD